MPVDAKPERQSSPWLTRRGMTTLLVILVSSSIPVQADEPAHEFFPGSMINGDLGGEIDLFAERTVLPGVPTEPALSPATSRFLRKLGSQVIDQSGHVVVAAGPIWASRYLAGVPWYGWLVTPVLAYREWTQWPSNRWWDPPLDWTFLTLGVVWATWGPMRRRNADRAPERALISRARSAARG